jgi:hypothetical protein
MKTSELATNGSGIGFSNGRFQPQSVIMLPAKNAAVAANGLELN